MFNLDDISQYCENHSTQLDEVLKELMSDTRAHVPGSQMISGHLVGQLLTLFSQMMRPSCIIELGTYTGFSAICLAKGLSDGGRLITIDIDDRWNEMREKYWKKSGLFDKITLMTGPGLEILSQLDISPELAFVDADKGNYIPYTEHLISIMKSGSIIIVDNVLFKNEVLLSDSDDMSKTAQHITAFNKKIINDSRVDILMLPIRDGITILKVK